MQHFKEHKKLKTDHKLRCSHETIILANRFYSLYLSHTEQDTISFILGFVIVCVAVIS